MRKVRSLVFDDGELKEFQDLDEALNLIKVTMSPNMLALFDSTCTVFFVDPPGDVIPDRVGGMSTAGMPETHKHNIASAGGAMMHTLSTRHPVLVVDMQPKLLMVVAPAGKVERIVKDLCKLSVSLTTPPIDKQGRWVVSVDAARKVIKTAIAIGPKRGIGQA